ncbi:MAG: PilZ domain-containing protein [Cyanobacteriota bacterium]|nr:PilZ domain-containing protein [Cyanobacteriota bacterium]
MQSIDLIAFRIALRELSDALPAEDRRSEARYHPTGRLSRAQVLINGDSTKIDADVVDLNPSGMRLAVGPGTNCSAGDRCSIEIALHLQQLIRLNGEIRWVTHHPYITVFGVLLDPGNTADQAV